MSEILDMKCARAGSEIASAVKDETLITKSLGVLQEDGVYAFFLYLASKKEPAVRISQRIFTLLRDEVLQNVLGKETDVLNAVRDRLAEDLNHLIFAKGLIERTLVYARYHCRALDKALPVGGKS